MAARNAAAAVDWATIYGRLGLGRETVASLQAFRARNTSAANRNAALKSTIPEIDISHYKNVLRDQQVVGQLEKVLNDFKPVTYDVAKWDQLVNQFETKAVDAAKQTLAKIQTEEKGLNETLSNIKDARSFDELTIHDVAHARPEVQKTVDNMVKKGKWGVPGYRESFGEMSVL
ncbi:hypothetical protein BD324DRAFT_605578 [Kockovaella imperatae]|uniref:ATP synthase subunit d, mitochondrial n=1 Tax=Kockovaella imperatae TaxID=4999 RepID=A0A1Y1U889_9TREE|nr:hypothetical protein BD324DRAFT_605578 [Kockovaella imperatae]ORX33764.1 hypothetical protein BD324DRAFT_605578 [Kockovaella imperatae]